MHQESPSDAEVEGWLKTLGIELLCQWDVLFFLYRHQASLLDAEHLARLLGYTAEQVVAALDVLEALRFVERSRVSQNVRLYQLTAPSEPPRGHAFERLQALAGHRAGRLVLSKHLRRREGSPQERLSVIWRFGAEERETWHKAI